MELDQSQENVLNSLRNVVTQQELDDIEKYCTLQANGLDIAPALYRSLEDILKKYSGSANPQGGKGI